MFRGSIVALITPMLNDQVDVERLRELVDYHVNQGTQAIVAAGTTGEAGTLSLQEKILVISTVVDQAKERIPVIAGTAANSTKDCIHLTQLAMSKGAYAALIMTPAYIKPTQEGLYQHYETIARAVAMPIILYNVPSRTGCDLLPETVARLSKISNIIGIKEATGQMERLAELQSLPDGEMDIYSGDDLSAADWMLAGAKGVISVTANIAPKQMTEMSQLALDGDKEACLTRDQILQPLHKMMFVESNPIPVKWAAYRIGLVNDEIRMPMTRLAVRHRQPLDDLLMKLDLMKV